jgi:hypothetical protein
MGGCALIEESQADRCYRLRFILNLPQRVKNQVKHICDIDILNDGKTFVKLGLEINLISNIAFRLKLKKNKEMRFQDAGSKDMLKCVHDE